MKNRIRQSLYQMLGGGSPLVAQVLSLYDKADAKEKKAFSGIVFELLHRQEVLQNQMVLLQRKGMKLRRDGARDSEAMEKLIRRDRNANRQE